MKKDTQLDDSCNSCAWYIEASAGTHGYCKRFPPVLTGHDDRGRPKFYNPVVGPNNFCGEFEEAED